MKIYIPHDSSSIALGAEGLVTEIKTLMPEAEIYRNGSRGLYWLEPMIEIEDGDQRIAFGPVEKKDIPALLNKEDWQSLDCHLGPVNEIPELKKQTRLTFKNCGKIDALSIENYKFMALKKSVGQSSEQIIEEIKKSGLRGRGGAAFPTGVKWETVSNAALPTGHKWNTVYQAPAGQKYIVCNADEGDSGSFADRMIMEGDPYSLIEGMIIAGIAVGATQGYIYLRSEYPNTQKILQHAVDNAYESNYLGKTDKYSFELEIRMGAESYICGEETALLESLEGKRGMVRYRPPLPAIEGLFGKPTVVNNVLTLASVPFIISEGAEKYAELGEGRSKGTLPIQLSGNIKYPGLYELPFGLTLRELIYDIGGGTASGKPFKALQAGGPLGAYLPEEELDTPITYEDLADIDAMLGHGGIVVFDETVNMSEQARFAMEFCSIESCGKCTPCRIGSVRGVEVIDKITSGIEIDMNLDLLQELCDTMLAGSLCGLGGMAPYPVISALKYFPKDFGLSQQQVAA